jgi:hypothetical protein
VREGCGPGCSCQAPARASDRSRSIFSSLFGSRYSVEALPFVGEPWLFRYTYFLDPPQEPQA